MYLSDRAARIGPSRLYGSARIDAAGSFFWYGEHAPFPKGTLDMIVEKVKTMAAK